MLPQKKRVWMASTFLLFLFLHFFYLFFLFCATSQVLCAGSFSSISFTFNDMIIHISRLFQIITAFQSLFTLTSPPNVLLHSTCSVIYFFSETFIFLMAIIENVFPQKQYIIICHRGRGKEMIEQFSKWYRVEG